MSKSPKNISHFFVCCVTQSVYMSGNQRQQFFFWGCVKKIVCEIVEPICQIFFLLLCEEAWRERADERAMVCECVCVCARACLL